ncbi:MAG: hypothetical protein ACOC8F_07870 [Planctomycetota bacterium]
MSQASTQEQSGPVIPVKPAPNVYTVLLIISVLALCVGIGVVLWRMTGSLPDGFGVPLKDVFQPGTPTPGT